VNVREHILCQHVDRVYLLGQVKNYFFKCGSGNFLFYLRLRVAVRPSKQSFREPFSIHVEFENAFGKRTDTLLK
jgi:hypothetical protein